MSEDTTSTQFNEIDRLELAAEVVSAYVSNNAVQTADLPGLMVTIHSTLARLATGAGQASEMQVEKPTAARIRKSITPDALISFEDGKPYKTLRRHLTIRGLTAEAYREKYGLPSDYPMTAASYSAQRAELARSLGLGIQFRKYVAAPSDTRSDLPMGHQGEAKTVATE